MVYFESPDGKIITSATVAMASEGTLWGPVDMYNDEAVRMQATKMFGSAVKEVTAPTLGYFLEHGDTLHAAQVLVQRRGCSFPEVIKYIDDIQNNVTLEDFRRRSLDKVECIDGSIVYSDDLCFIFDNGLYVKCMPTGSAYYAVVQCYRKLDAVQDVSQVGIKHTQYVDKNKLEAFLSKVERI